MSKKEIIFPKNRKEVFLVLAKYHKMDLVKLNLLTVIFGILTIAVIYLFMLLIGKVPTLVSNGSIPLVKPGDMDYSIIFTSMVYLVTLFGCLVFTNIPLFLAFGGLIYAISQIIYGVYDYDVKKDFFIGIKRNWKNNLFLSLLFSIGCLFGVGVTALYILNEAPNAVRIISFIIAGLVTIAVSFITFIAINYNNIYDTSFIKMIRNSALLVIVHPFRSIGCLLMSLIPFGLLFIPFIIPIFPLLMIFFGFSYFIVFEILYSNFLFDKYINEKAHPEIVKRGMNHEDKPKEEKY